MVTSGRRISHEGTKTRRSKGVRLQKYWPLCALVALCEIRCCSALPSKSAHLGMHLPPVGPGYGASLEPRRGCRGTAKACRQAPEGSSALGRGSSGARPPVESLVTPEPRRGDRTSAITRSCCRPLRGRDVLGACSGGLPSVDPRPRADPTRSLSTTPRPSLGLGRILLHLWDATNELHALPLALAMDV